MDFDFNTISSEREPSIFDAIKNVFNDLAVLKETSALDEFLEFLYTWNHKEISGDERKWHTAFLKMISDPEICVLTGSSVLNYYIRNKTEAIIESKDFDFFIDIHSIDKIARLFEAEDVLKENYPELLEQSYKIPSYYRHEQAFSKIFNDYIFRSEYLNKLFRDYLIANKIYFEKLGITDKMSIDDILPTTKMDTMYSAIKTSGIADSSIESEYKALFTKNTDIITFRLSQSFIPINIIIPVFNIKSLLPKEFLTLAPEPVTPFFIKTHLYGVIENFDFENVKIYYNFDAKGVSSVYSLYCDHLAELIKLVSENLGDFQNEFDLKPHTIHMLSSILTLKKNQSLEFLKQYEEVVLPNPLDLKLSFNTEIKVKLLFSKINDVVHFFKNNSKDDNAITFIAPDIQAQFFNASSFHLISSFILQIWPRITKYIERGFEYKDEYGILDAIDLYFEIAPYLLNADGKIMNSIRRKNILRQSKNSILYRDIKKTLAENN